MIRRHLAFAQFGKKRVHNWVRGRPVSFLFAIFPDA